MQQSIAERRHGIADLVVLLAIVGLALAIWVSPVATLDAARWKLFLEVLPAVLLALAALTRHPGWAMAFRLLTGGWIATGPLLLGLSDLQRAALAIAVVIFVVAMVGVRRAGSVGSMAR